MLLGLVLIAIAAISWGTTGAVMAVVARETTVGPLVVGWARVAIASPCLLAAAVAVGWRRRGRPARAPRLTAGQVAGFGVLGIAMAAYQVCYFRAVTLTGVAVAALLAICSAPLAIALLAAVLLRERLGRSVLLSLAMAVAGTALVVIGPRGASDIAGGFGTGALLALGAGASYAGYAVAAKHVLARTEPVLASAVTFTVAALVLVPVLFAERPHVGDLRTAAPLLLYLGIGPTAAAYAAFTAGLKRVPATRAGIVTLLEPLTAALLGIAVFGESLGPIGLTGAALLLGGLAVLVVARDGSERAAPTTQSGSRL